MKTMTIPTLHKTTRGHCEKCGGAIKHRPDVERLWYQCLDCGMWQERRAEIKPDHEAVKVARQRKALGQQSHRQARQKGHIAA